MLLTCQPGQTKSKDDNWKYKDDKLFCSFHFTSGIYKDNWMWVRYPLIDLKETNLRIYRPKILLNLKIG